MKLISVVIPVYNVAEYLVECIESVLKQTYTNLEIILVDDGSLDNSGKICDDYAKKDSRIVVIHKQNGGLSSARNAALEIIKGCYVVFVDSDDYIESTMIEVLYNKINQYNADISICAYRLTSKIDIFDSEPECREFLMTGKKLIMAYINRDSNYTITHAVWNRLYKKELLEGLKFCEGRVHEDILFSTEVMLRIQKAIYVDKYLYNYRDNRPGSITGRKYSLKSVDDSIYLTCIATNKIREKYGREYGDIFAAQFYTEITAIRTQDNNKEVIDLIDNYRKDIKAIIKGVVKSRNVGKKLKIRLVLSLISPKLMVNTLKFYSVARRAFDKNKSRRK